MTAAIDADVMGVFAPVFVTALFVNNVREEEEKEREGRKGMKKHDEASVAKVGKE